MATSKAPVQSGTTATATGMPTKKLFIDTLVRDIDLAASIVDLVDNCIDGAKRLRPNGKFKGLKVDIKLNADKFSVIDNCGGIDVDIAERYAFRFGRDDVHDAQVKHSVGHFGVGMKRTLFKIAKTFSITSVAKKSRFELHLDVHKWQADKLNWDFPLTKVRRSETNAVGTTGTKIIVTSLRPEIAEEFGISKFQDDIRERIEIAHGFAINAGLVIHFNGELLKAEELRIRASQRLKPLLKSGTFHVGPSAEKVTYNLIAGVDSRDSDDSGWYVFCNGRLLLRADQTKITGWGEPPAPKHHQQFNYFRGYLFLEADNAGLLPWNTTKTGVSEDSEIYRRIVIEMASAIKSVTLLLNKVRDEDKLPAGSRTPLTTMIENAKQYDATDVSKVKAISAATFTWPSVSAGAQRDAGQKRITYVVDPDIYDRVRRRLKATSAEMVGSGTFDYFVEAELGDEV